MVSNEIQQIQQIALDAGFAASAKRGRDFSDVNDAEDDQIRELSIVYEDKFSYPDVLAMQIMIQGYDERADYEIYDYGYFYNVSGDDFAYATDPVFEGDDFEQANSEWTRRIEQKRAEILEDDDEQGQNTTLDDF